MKDPNTMEAPCQCEECGEWFDLSDGLRHPRKQIIIICSECAEAIEVSADREEEIEMLLDNIRYAKATISEGEKRLFELGYIPESAELLSEIIGKSSKEGQTSYHELNFELKKTSESIRERINNISESAQHAPHDGSGLNPFIQDEIGLTKPALSEKLIKKYRYPDFTSIYGSGWISSKKQLPPENKSVLVFIPQEDDHVTIGMWDVSKKWVLLDDYRVPNCEVTYWREIDFDLPEDKSFTPAIITEEQENTSSIIHNLQKRIFELERLQNK